MEGMLSLYERHLDHHLENVLSDLNMFWTPFRGQSKTEALKMLLGFF